MSANGTVALTSPPPSQPASAPASTVNISPTNVVLESTTLVVVTPTGPSSLDPVTVYKTSTTSPGLTRSSSLGQSSALSSTQDVLPLPTSSTGQSSGSHGLGSSGKIAVAVVVPVVAVALIIFVLLLLLKRHRRRRAAEEDRRKEVEEYSYNPNQDPTLPTIAAAANKGSYEMGQADGYRGWGQTPLATGGRKVPALPGGNGPVGGVYPDVGAPQGGRGSPPGAFSQTTGPASEVHSGDSLIPNPHHPEDPSTLAAIGGGPVAGENRQLDIHRGASNASSQYSAAARSELSGDGPIPVGTSNPQYYGGDGPYEVEGNYHPGGAYGEGAYQPYNGGQPVIRDVQARRNTRIENPTVFPQQGNAGISRNF